MRVGQLSESDAVDVLMLPFYSSSHPTGSHGWRNQFDLGNPDSELLRLCRRCIALPTKAPGGLSCYEWFYL